MIKPSKPETQGIVAAVKDGFGFIKREKSSRRDNNDSRMFFHSSELLDKFAVSGRRRIKMGDEVEFTGNIDFHIKILYANFRIQIIIQKCDQIRSQSKHSKGVVTLHGYVLFHQEIPDMITITKKKNQKLVSDDNNIIVILKIIFKLKNGRRTGGIQAVMWLKASHLENLK